MQVKCEDPIDEIQSKFVYCIINHWQTLNFALCKRDGITDRQTYGQTEKQTDGENIPLGQNF